MTGLELLAIAKDSALTVAAGSGAWAAIQGLRTWQRQLRWQQGRELATKLLQAAWDIRRHVRTLPHSGHGAFDERDREKSARKFEVTAEGSQNFLDELAIKMAKFDEFVAEALIVWGNDFRKHVERLRDAEQTLKFFQSQDCTSMSPYASAGQRMTARRLRTEMHDEIWGGGPGAEKGVFLEVSEVISELENALRAKDFK